MTTKFNGISLPTTYNGIQFRSRLEARWAIFFDAMSTPWEYEPENFKTTYGPYLPDFYLPELKSFFIVKGEELPDDEERKCYEVDSITGKRVIMAIGGIPQVFSDDDRYFQLYWSGGDWPYFFCRCTACGALTFQWNGLADRHCEIGSVGDNSGIPRHDTEEIQIAIKLARTAKYGINFT